MSSRTIFSHAGVHAGGNYVVRERGNFTLRDGKVTPVEGRAVLVVSDLDDTMVRAV